MKNFAGKLWRSGGLIYLLFCLAGLAVGLWPGAIYPADAGRAAPLPTLQTLGVAQVGFFLLAWPVVIEARLPSTSGRRLNKHSAGCRGGSAATVTFELAELAGFFVIALPMYIAAGWLADATITDGLRTALAVAAVCPLGWQAGRWLAIRSARGAVLLGLVIITPGMVGLYYVSMDFLGNIPAGWIWNLSPVCFAWSAAEARAVGCIPQPLWAWLAWPGVAAAACLMKIVLSPMRTPNN